MSRDEEDYELEVGSAGLGQPFKVLRQWQNHVDKPVEIITTDGRKLKGILHEAEADHIVLTTRQKVQVEGKKRPELVEEQERFNYNDIKYTKNIINI